MKGRIVWILSGKLLAFAFSVILPLLLVRRVSQAEFGLYKQAFLVVASALAILPLGFGMTVYYFFPREPERRSAVVLNILLFYFCIGSAAFVLLLSAPNLLGALLVGGDVAAQHPDMREQLQALAPYIGAVIAFWLFSSFLEAVTIANAETKHATAFIILAQLTKSALLVIAAIGFGSVRALLYAALIQGVLQSAALLMYVRSRFPGFWRHFDAALLKRQAIYAAPYSLSALTWTLQTDMHNYFVSHHFGQVGFAIYAVGVFQIPLIGLLTESVASVMIPRVSYLQSIDDRREIIRLATAAVKKLALVILPIYAFLMIAGREFIVTLFTDRYLESWPIFQINITFLPFAIVPLDAICRGYEQLGRFITKVRLITLPVLALGLWATVRQGDLRAVAAVATALYVVETVITTYRAADILGVRKGDIALGYLARIVVACGGAGAATVTVRYIALSYHSATLVTLALEAVTFGVTYLLFAVALKLITPDEMELLPLTRRTSAHFSRL